MTSALPVRERESGEVGPVFGLKCTALFGIYDPDLQLWRTLERSLFEDLPMFWDRLPRSGMMRSGRIYEQKTWVLRTEGKGSGSWPTPKATEWKGANGPGKGGHSGMYLTGAVKKWPTPHGLSSNQGQGDGEFGKAIRESTEATGQLNPTWVDWLMGYPIGWSDLEATGMQLSLK